MTKIIYDADAGEMYEVEATDEEIREAVAELYGEESLTDDEYGEKLYDMAWTIFDKADVVKRSSVKEILESPLLG